MRRLKRIWTGLLALCLAVLLTPPAHAWPGVEGSGGGESTINIEVYEKQPTLTIQVVDKATGAGLPNVRVELRDPDHPDTPPITGSPLGVHETDADGKIEIKLFPDADKKYQIFVDHLGYDPYVGDVFIVLDDTHKRVELVKPIPPGGDDDDNDRWVYYHAGAGGSLDGVEKERVSYNASPKKVPTPVPKEGYTFAGWMLDGKYVEPEKLKVRKSIHLYAVFELLPPPTPPVTPQPTPPPTPTPPVTPQPSPPPSPQGPTPQESSKPRPSKRPMTPGTLGHGGTDSGGPDDGGPEQGPDDTLGPTLEPGPTEPDPGPDVPAFGPGTLEPATDDGHDHTQCTIHWWILLCAVLTAALGLLRLWVIRRKVKRLEEETREEEKELIMK